MNGNETGTVEYWSELAFNSNLPNFIVLNVAFYMHLIWQFDPNQALDLKAFAITSKSTPAAATLSRIK